MQKVYKYYFDLRCRNCGVENKIGGFISVHVGTITSEDFLPSSQRRIFVFVQAPLEEEPTTKSDLNLSQSNTELHHIECAAAVCPEVASEMFILPFP